LPFRSRTQSSRIEKPNVIRFKVCKIYDGFGVPSSNINIGWCGNLFFSAVVTSPRIKKNLGVGAGLALDVYILIIKVLLE